MPLTALLFLTACTASTVANRSYRLSPLAEGDLEDIWLYSAQQWSMPQADRYIEDFLTAFAELADGERSGATVAARKGYLRLLVGSHVIFYRETDSHIDVIRILHQSMDERRHLQ